MASHFRWPFSMKYLYTVDEFRPTSHPPSSIPMAAPEQSTQSRTFTWPFSWKYLYTVDEFRRFAPSTSTSSSSTVADLVLSRDTTSSTLIGAEGLYPSADLSRLSGSEYSKSDEESEPPISSDSDYFSSSRSSLRRRMFSSFAKSTFDGHHSRRFLPEGSLTRLVTEDSIRLELDDRRLQRDPIIAELVPYICSKATRLFATAVYMKCTRKTLLRVMHLLYIKSFTDKDLPMQLEDENSKWAGLRWSKDLMEDFYDAQWAFLAPVFFRPQSFYGLSPDCILPFLNLEAKDVGVFASSSITKGRIHEDHFPLTQRTTNECVAVKQIGRKSTAEEKSWLTKWQTLQEISKFNHSHILCPIGAFKKGYDGYFIFPWADGGSLRDLWGQDKRLSLDKNGVTQSVFQLRGLFDALRSVHNSFSPPHGNLKPENILVFPNDKSSIGNLKIGDWGLSGIQLKPIKPKYHQTITRHGTRLYEAPEAPVGNGTRLQSCDVWALGCVALEHLVWLLYGEEEHERFIAHLVKEDTEGFYRCTVERPIVKPDVVRWMIHITDHFPLGTSLGDLVEVIRTKMLVIDLPPKRETGRLNESINGPYRAKAYEIHIDLGIILYKLTADDDYCFPDRPYDWLRGPDDYPATHEASSSGEPN